MYFFTITVETVYYFIINIPCVRPSNGLFGALPIFSQCCPRPLTHACVTQLRCVKRVLTHDEWESLCMCVFNCMWIYWPQAFQHTATLYCGVLDIYSGIYIWITALSPVGERARERERVTLTRPPPGTVQITRTGAHHRWLRYGFTSCCDIAVSRS